MRILMKRLACASNISFARLSATTRFSSSDPKKETKPDESKTPPTPAPNESKTQEVNVSEIKRNIVIEHYGGIMTINIDRQCTRNSLDIETLRDIEAALKSFDDNPEAKVLVFSGEGGSFSSGFDMNDMASVGYMALKDASQRLLCRPMCVKPTIAAVAGYAVAEGFELALACDLRIVEDTAMLGFTGRRFGVPASLFGARRLTSLISLSPALDLILTGRLISGQEAFQKGLASKVTATGTALGEAIKLAKSLVKFPCNALVMDKMAAINSQLASGTEESMRDEAIMQSLLGNALVDMNEGIKKFQDGIGRHGKFQQISEVPMKDWELEDSAEETIVTIDDSEKTPGGETRK